MKLKGIKEFLLDWLGDLVRCGGEQATEEHSKEREIICDGCEYSGMVYPLPLISTKGCTICKCPFMTKTKTITNCNFAEGKPLEKVITVCPHPSGNKWADVDNKFLNFKH